MNGALQIGVGVLAQSSLLLLLGLLVGGLLRRRGPEVRAFIYQVTLAGVVLGALLSIVIAGRIPPLWAVTLPAIQAAEGGMSMPAPESPHPAPAFPSAPYSPADPQAHPARAADVPQITSPLTSRGRSYIGVVVVWLCGSGLLLLWLTACQWHLALLRRGSKTIAEGAAHEKLARLCVPLGVRPPLLLTNPRVRSPFLAGILRPAILLPATWEMDYDEPTLQVILAHELAHHARRDCAWTLLLRLTCAVLWMQPLLWLLGRQMEQASEEACDLMALTPDCPPRRYADCLLILAERVFPSTVERTLGAGIVPVRSSLGRRIQNILDRRNHTMTTLSTRLRVTITLGLVTTSLAGAFLVSASAPAQKPAPAASPLVGVWLFHDGDHNHAGTITFLANGQCVLFNPDTNGLTYGTYAVSGDTIKLISTRLEKGSDAAKTGHLPETTAFRFTIVGDTLTIIPPGDGSHEVATRIGDVGTGAATPSFRPTDGPPTIMITKATVLTLAADKAAAAVGGQELHLSGGVQVRSNDQTLTSDRVTLDPSTKTLEFFGHVKVTSADGTELQMSSLMLHYLQEPFNMRIGHP